MPNTTLYLLAGYLVIVGGILLYVITLFLRIKSVKRMIRLSGSDEKS